MRHIATLAWHYQKGRKQHCTLRCDKQQHDVDTLEDPLCCQNRGALEIVGPLVRGEGPLERSILPGLGQAGVTPNKIKLKHSSNQRVCSF